MREDDAAIERYRAVLPLLPPIVIARDGILVDGLHRWQAHRREKAPDIAAVNLGNLSDLEIRIEAIRRNNAHGVPFITQKKRKAADQLYRDGMRGEAEMAALLSLTPSWRLICATPSATRRMSRKPWRGICESP